MPNISAIFFPSFPTTDGFHFCQSDAKKAANLFQDLLLFVPLARRLFGCNRRAVHSELKQCFQQRFRYVVLGFLVVSPIDTGGVPYLFPVILQDPADGFRLPAGGFHDCFIGEKFAIPHTSFPPFPRKAALRIFGYGSLLCCGCTRTVCQFHAVEYA